MTLCMQHFSKTLTGTDYECLDILMQGKTRSSIKILITSRAINMDQINISHVNRKNLASSTWKHKESSKLVLYSLHSLLYALILEVGLTVQETNKIE